VLRRASTVRPLKLRYHGDAFEILNVIRSGVNALPETSLLPVPPAPSLPASVERELIREARLADRRVCYEEERQARERRYEEYLRRRREEGLPT
jgi:hypothetical protein